MTSGFYVEKFPGRNFKNSIHSSHKELVQGVARSPCNGGGGVSARVKLILEKLRTSKPDGRISSLIEVLYICYIQSKKNVLSFIGSLESCMQKKQGPDTRDAF